MHIANAETSRKTESRGIALALSYFTVGYNILEGLLSVLFASLTGSSALLGFGIDSFVESLSGLVMIWRFSGEHDSESEERAERIAIRLVGISLLVFSGYVAYDAAKSLYAGVPPERSIVGLLIAAVSLIVMPVLFTLKQRTAKKIRSRSLAADAKQTFACVLLSVALLAGTGVNYLTDFWQADPLAGLSIAAYLIYEAYRAIADKRLCDSC